MKTRKPYVREVLELTQQQKTFIQVHTKRSARAIADALRISYQRVQNYRNELDLNQ